MSLTNAHERTSSLSILPKMPVTAITKKKKKMKWNEMPKNPEKLHFFYTFVYETADE